MYCLVCRNDLRDCTCEDIDQRLADLARCPDCAIAPAAQTNLIIRRILERLDSLPIAGHA